MYACCIVQTDSGALFVLFRQLHSRCNCWFVVSVRPRYKLQRSFSMSSLRGLYGNDDYRRILIGQKQLCYENLERMRGILDGLKAEIASKYEELDSMKGYDPATKRARTSLFEEIQQLKSDKKDLLESFKEEHADQQDVTHTLAVMC